MSVNTPQPTRPVCFRLLGQLLLAAALAGSGGCSWDGWNYLRPPPPTAAPPAESLVLRPEGFIPEKPAPKSQTEAEGPMFYAREAFRKEDYGTASDLFDRIADNKKNPITVVQEAIYYRAESERLQSHYPKAADLYVDLLNKFPQSPYREQAVQHMFDIANYWLNDTREEMKEDKERREGKRWIVWPHFVNFNKTKPLLDEQGRAVEKLDQVRIHDLNGPLADQALFMAGTVKLFNENYRDADHYFSQIHVRHPESPLAQKSLELAIYCKHMSTGGPDYDGRKCAEARKLIQTAFASYPEMTQNKEKEQFLLRQLENINFQQAEKDFRTGQFYERTGHPGSAYWYYELVRRRYPNTKCAEKAAERMNVLRAKLEKEEAARATKAEKAGPPPAPAGAKPADAKPPDAANAQQLPAPRPAEQQPQTLPAPRPVESSSGPPPRPAGP
jgi:outer membrane protein assembly factor BamD (BamD/ComL family)